MLPAILKVFLCKLHFRSRLAGLKKKKTKNFKIYFRCIDVNLYVDTIN